MVAVLNLLTQERREYSCDARAAAICAYAQERGDWNTWDYEQTYGPMVKAGRYGWHAGDWSAPKPRDEWFA